MLIIRQTVVIFGVEVALGWDVQKCQNGVCDFDLENEVKVQRSQNFDYLYLCHFFIAESKCLVFGERLTNVFKVCE